MKKPAMRRLLLTSCLLLTPLAVLADTVAGIDWQLSAIDGQAVEASVLASLRIKADDTVFGKAPCNSFAFRNKGTLPVVRLGAIDATRMACGTMAQEGAFFDTLAVVDLAALGGDQSLILTGPEGRSLKFVGNRTLDATVCTTCPRTE